MNRDSVISVAANRSTRLVPAAPTEFRRESGITLAGHFSAVSPVAPREAEDGLGNQRPVGIGAHAAGGSNSPQGLGHGGLGMQPCRGEDRDGAVLGADQELNLGTAENDAFRALVDQFVDDLLVRDA